MTIFDLQNIMTNFIDMGSTIHINGNQLELRWKIFSFKKLKSL